MKQFLLSFRTFGWLIIAVIIMLDQWSKAWIVALKTSGMLPMAILPFFNLTWVQNRGISFGLFSHMQDWVPIILTLCNSTIVIILGLWLVRAHDKVTPLAIGLIMGGAIGNIIDRIRLDAVTDFLDFYIGKYHWPAFNVADSAIFIGVVILLLLSIVKKENPLVREK